MSAAIKHKGRKVKTMVGPLKWVFIKGEGRNTAMPGQPPRYQYLATLRVKENGPEHKHMLEQIEAEWNDYKKKFGVKGRPSSIGIKPYMIPDPSGEIDPETEEVRKIPSGEVDITFKTDVKWPDGKPKVIKVYDAKGNDITQWYQNLDGYIGDGSTGVIHGIAHGNNAGGNHKVSLYLSAVQLAKFVKGEGDAPDVEEIEGEEIDIGDSVPAINDAIQNSDNNASSSEDNPGEEVPV